MIAVGSETGLAVDDVEALTDLGGVVVIQAKGRLQSGTQPTSAFAEAVIKSFASSSRVCLLAIAPDKWMRDWTCW